MQNNFNRTQLIVENSFANTQKNSEELGITAFKRAFYKLTDDKKYIGKIFPMYIKIREFYRILGVFTLNQGGTTSFFPEFPGLFFDHITFGKKLGDSAHLTEIVNRKRKKVTRIDANPLSNGTYHLMTLMVSDENLLKPAPHEIIYPEIEIQYLNDLKQSFFTRGGYNGSGTIDAMNEGNLTVVQILMVPTDCSFQDIQFSPSVVKHFPGLFDDLKHQDVKMHIARFAHEYQDDYCFGFIGFNYKFVIDASLYFTFSANRDGHYFNSEDKDMQKRFRMRQLSRNT